MTNELPDWVAFSGDDQKLRTLFLKSLEASLTQRVKFEQNGIQIASNSLQLFLPAQGAEMRKDLLLKLTGHVSEIAKSADHIRKEKQTASLLTKELVEIENHLEILDPQASKQAQDLLKKLRTRMLNAEKEEPVTQITLSPECFDFVWPDVGLISMFDNGSARDIKLPRGFQELVSRSFEDSLDPWPVFSRNGVPIEKTSSESASVKETDLSKIIFRLRSSRNRLLEDLENCESYDVFATTRWKLLVRATALAHMLLSFRRMSELSTISTSVCPELEVFVQEWPEIRLDGTLSALYYRSVYSKNPQDRKVSEALSSSLHKINKLLREVGFETSGRSCTRAASLAFPWHLMQPFEGALLENPFVASLFTGLFSVKFPTDNLDSKPWLVTLGRDAFVCRFALKMFECLPGASALSVSSGAEVDEVRDEDKDEDHTLGSEDEEDFTKINKLVAQTPVLPSVVNSSHSAFLCPPRRLASEIWGRL